MLSNGLILGVKEGNGGIRFYSRGDEPYFLIL